MKDLGEKVVNALTQSFVDEIRKGGMVAPNYKNRIEIPADLISSCWEMVDIDKVKSQIAQHIEDQLAERIVNSIAAEIATDIKQILSVKERREAIRALARNNMEAILKGEAQ